MSTEPEVKSPSPALDRAAEAVLRVKPNVQRGKTLRPAKWRMAKVPDAEKKLYAAALVYYNNITAAFNEVFADRFPALPKPTLHYYARQLNADEVVRKEVSAIMNARTDAKMDECRDLRRLAIEAVANLARMIKADHDSISAALLGQPVEAIHDLPEFARGVIAEYTVREKSTGEVIISGIKLHDPKKANEIMQKWIEFSRDASATGYTAESLPVDVMPDDSAPRAPVGGVAGGSGEVGAGDIG